MKKSLYLSRSLLNGAEFLEWAKSQGFTKTLKPESLHVTIAYSTEELEWDDVKPKEDTIRIFGGKRSVIPLGDMGAVVLKFKTHALQERWKELVNLGASWSYESYQPHVSITYDGTDLDLSKVEPYEGELVFGPEQMEEIKEEWKPKEE